MPARIVPILTPYCGAERHRANKNLVRARLHPGDNGGMRPSIYLLVLLVLATLALDCAAVDACRASAEDHARWWWLAPLMLSQVSLLAIWLALGCGRLAWRLLAATAGVLLWSGWFAGERGTSDARQVAFHLAAQVAAVMLFAVALRAVGARIVNADREAPIVNKQRRWQFTLGQSLCAITGASLLLAFLTQAEISAGRATIWLTLAVGDALLAILCLWLVCGARRWPTRIPAGLFGIAIVALGLVLYGEGLSASKDESLAKMIRVPMMMPSALPRVAGGELSHGGRTVAGFVCPQILLLIASLAIVRVAGYRLGLSHHTNATRKRGFATIRPSLALRVSGQRATDTRPGPQ